MTPLLLQQDNLFGLPVVHYSFEMAAQVRYAIDHLHPDCIAVELPESLQTHFLQAAGRLPDLSLLAVSSHSDKPLYFPCEPCDPLWEGVRSALEREIDVACIDLDVEHYPQLHEPMPDTYAIHKLGLRKYYESYLTENHSTCTTQDMRRELYMAHRLRELSLQYERVLFISGMFHTLRVLEKSTQKSFPNFLHAQRSEVLLYTYTDRSAREVMAVPGWFTRVYESWREANHYLAPDRQRAIYHLYKLAANEYVKETGLPFEGYHLRNTMKFGRNCALYHRQLLPNLYEIVQAAKGCVDDNFAYQVWELATQYPPLRNIDGLPTIDLSAQELWGNSRRIHFRPKQKRFKGMESRAKQREKRPFEISPPGPFCICSHPPEDVRIERFGLFLREKGTQLLSEETAKSLPFTTSLEDGIDVRETVRNWHTGRLYVRQYGKPPGPTGSVVMIFDTDSHEEKPGEPERYPWRVTWHGEHNQESDMAFYATRMTECPVGPGMSRCNYGGFMMTYPPRRLYDVWEDSEYQSCRNKAELLLMAAIDYSVDPVIVYVAASPPRRALKQHAARYGKRIAYLPIGQLSPIHLAKIRRFHVLDGHDKRSIADEYIT